MRHSLQKGEFDREHPKIRATLVNLIKWSHVKKMYHRGSTVPNAAASGCSKKKTDRWILSLVDVVSDYNKSHLSGLEGTKARLQWIKKGEN